MKKSESLQALRGIAFLGIFFIHSHFSINWAGIGVSLFFVLSGFLCEKKYGATFDKTDAKHSFLFAWGRIRKIYPLHIILMLLWALKKLSEDHSLSAIAVKTAEILLNVTLTQSWVPNSNINVCLNGVAWFLSSITAHYLIFPSVSIRLRLEKSLRKPVIVLILMMMLQVFSCWFIKAVFHVSNEVYSWFMYVFPVFRFVDFYAGMCLSHLTGDTQTDKKLTFNRSMIETGAVLLTFLLYQSLHSAKLGSLHTAIYNGTTIYILPAALWIWLFFQKEGIITHLLSLRPFVFLGNLSSYLFLIHFPITQFDGWLLTRTDNVYIITGVELILSVLLATAYSKAEPYIIEKIKTIIYN